MKAKYALKSLIFMASKSDTMLQSKEIAKQADVPLKFLEAILQELKQMGIVNSKRGVFGGYFLAKKTEFIMIGDIIRNIDGPLAPVRCASLTAYQKCDDCISEVKCSIRKTMLEVRNAIANILDNKSLADMVQTNMDYVI
jgi:Rrf2 family protein